MNKERFEQRKMRVYSGTTLDNYRTCAFINEQQQVVFNKAREPRYAFGSFFYVPAFEGAARYAFERANELGGNPLVISGLMDEENWTVRHTYELANGEFFVVNGVWLPKKGLDWHQLNPYGKGLSKEFFDEFDPKKLLTK